MKKYRQHTLKEYLDVLSKREPVPGGGSVAAYSAALAVGLISMVVRYSQGRSKKKTIEKRLELILDKSETIRCRLLELTDLDAQAYLQVVAARKKDAKAKRAALKQAKAIPTEVSQLCYRAVDLTPFLVKNGNPYLISDIEVAVELLTAAYKSAMINVAVNQ